MSRACDHALEYVYHYLDREATVTRRVRIRWHLRKCARCCGAYEIETRVAALVRERTQEEPPPELMTRLRALIREESV